MRFNTPQLIFVVLMRQMPLYTNIKGRMVVYWLSNIGVRSFLPKYDIRY